MEMRLSEFCKPTPLIAETKKLAPQAMGFVDLLEASFQQSRQETVSVLRRHFDTLLDDGVEEEMCLVPSELRGSVYKIILGVQHIDESFASDDIMIDESIRVDMERTRSGQAEWNEHAEKGAKQQVLELLAHFCKSRCIPCLSLCVYVFECSSYHWIRSTRNA